jgi:hypothetical protein
LFELCCHLLEAIACPKQVIRHKPTAKQLLGWQAHLVSDEDFRHCHHLGLSIYTRIAGLVGLLFEKISKLGRVVVFSRCSDAELNDPKKKIEGIAVAKYWLHFGGKHEQPGEGHGNAVGVVRGGKHQLRERWPGQIIVLGDHSLKQNLTSLREAGFATTHDHPAIGCSQLTSTIVRPDFQTSPAQQWRKTEITLTVMLQTELEKPGR